MTGIYGEPTSAMHKTRKLNKARHTKNKLQTHCARFSTTRRWASSMEGESIRWDFAWNGFLASHSMWENRACLLGSTNRCCSGNMVLKKESQTENSKRESDRHYGGKRKWVVEADDNKDEPSIVCVWVVKKYVCRRRRGIGNAFSRTGSQPLEGVYCCFDHFLALLWQMTNTDDLIAILENDDCDDVPQVLFP